MYQRIRELITQYADIGLEEITLETRFGEDLDFSSYDFLAMLGDLEDEFDIEVDMNDMMELNTVGDVLQYVERVSAA